MANPVLSEWQFGDETRTKRHPIFPSFKEFGAPVHSNIYSRKLAGRHMGFHGFVPSFPERRLRGADLPPPARLAGEIG